jgi:hypothetical protein
VEVRRLPSSNCLEGGLEEVVRWGWLKELYSLNSEFHFDSPHARRASGHCPIQRPGHSTPARICICPRDIHAPFCLDVMRKIRLGMSLDASVSKPTGHHVYIVHFWSLTLNYGIPPGALCRCLGHNQSNNMRWSPALCRCSRIERMQSIQLPSPWPHPKLPLNYSK